MMIDAAGVIRERKLRLTRAAIGMISVVVLLFGPKALFGGIAVHAAASSFALFVAALASFYSREGALNTASTLLLVAFWICIVVALTSAGGMPWAAMGWFPILVMLAGVVGGTHHCLSWSAISALTLVGFWGVQTMELNIEHLTVDNLILDSRLHGLTQLLVASVLAFAYAQVNAELERSFNARADLLQREVNARQQAQAATIRFERAKSLFLSSISHEIRTPLNSIIGFSSRLIKRQCLVDPKDEGAVLGIA